MKIILKSDRLIHIFSSKKLTLVIASFLLLPVLTSCGSSPKNRALSFTIKFDTSDPHTVGPTLNSNEFSCLPKGHFHNLGNWSFGSAKFSLGDVGSIFDSPWTTSSIEMFDGSKKLIGVPDSYKILLAGEGKCSITFQFSHLALASGPIRIQSPATNYGWDFPPSQWLTGKVSGQDTGGRY